VRVHETANDLAQKIFNDPLDLHRGELVRFDLSGRTLFFTWNHALMDAKSAEYFLAMVGGDEIFPPEQSPDWYAERGMRVKGLRARFHKAWQELKRMDIFRNALPISLATHRPPATPKMKYQAVAFSAQESSAIHAHAARLAGFLANASFHLAATLVELHQLHQRLNLPSASYVAPIPVGLRPKGTRSPLFSNQVTMMLHQFFPAELDNMEHAIAAVKERNAASLRDDALDSGITLGQLFRAMPLPLNMRLIKQQLRGEICSLFFGDAGPADPALKNFFGASIEKFVHVPAVTMPPGVGVVFYRFGEQLQFTVVYADGTLTDNEAGEFAAHLRTRLLNP